MQMRMKNDNDRWENFILRATVIDRLSDERSIHSDPYLIISSLVLFFFQAAEIAHRLSCWELGYNQEASNHRTETAENPSHSTN